MKAEALSIPKQFAKTAPSFNGRTADSGSAYRGSNPWGAANSLRSFLSNQATHFAKTGKIQGIGRKTAVSWLLSAIKKSKRKHTLFGDPVLHPATQKQGLSGSRF